MLMSGAGYEVSIRNVISGASEWRPVVFFALLMTNQGPGIQVWYLGGDGSLVVAGGGSKIRQVGA